MKVVLAYSGGLDTSVILHWIKHTHQAEVITYTADVGQGPEVDRVREAALRTGASEVVIEDLRDEFARECIFPAVAANARYETYYLMGTSLARPVTARGMVRTAVKYGADAISHGSTGKGNDQVRFEMAAYALKPDIKVIAPWREWSFKGRPDLIQYAAQHGIPMPAVSKPEYSMDANLMHISYEGGILEDPWSPPPSNMFRLTVDPEDAPNQPEHLLIGFERGVPVSVNGERLGPAALVQRLNEIGGRHGVGRVDVVENRLVGIKSRGVYETPGVTLLHLAARAIESLTLDREALHLRDELSPKYAEMAYSGSWYTPEREALQVLIDKIAEPVTGEARLKLYKGSATIDGRRSPTHSLYNSGLSSFDKEGGYNQADATGFIRIRALRLKAQRPT
jgi:argininosuccinate synthase